jgi:hypothetical protein
MDESYHQFSELFRQLGLPTDIDGIRNFLAQHSPLDTGTKLEEAPFWSEAQASFLREAIMQDADWAEVVDQLNAVLRNRRQA